MVGYWVGYMGPAYNNLYVSWRIYNKLLGGIEVGYMGPVTAPIALLISSHPTLTGWHYRVAGALSDVEEGTLSVEWAKYTYRS